LTPLRSQTIFLTWWCNIACTHCAFRSGPHRVRESIDADVARRVLDAAASRGATLACFTGGEVFSVFELLCELMAYAQQRGLVSEVVTNCFWARDPEAARAKVARLRRLGLANLMVSYDRFHMQQHIPVSAVRHAVHAALAEGAHVQVRIVQAGAAPVTAEDAIRELELPREHIGGDGMPIRIVETEALLSGAAFDTLGEADVCRRPADALARVPCSSVIENPTLSPSGVLYACCGLGAATDEGPAQIARIGSVHEHTPDELYDRMQGHLLLNLIHSVGTVTVIDMARAYAPGQEFRCSYSNNCDACGELARNAGMQHAVQALLADLETSHAGH
jgi:Radical SAM superfamily